MGTGLVVVLVVTGLFALLPLWFAWLSTDSRRWQRVERILGREPRSGMDPSRWLCWAWMGLSAAYLITGALSVAGGRERIVSVVLLFLGIAYGARGGVCFYVRWRRQRERADPGAAGAQVEGGPAGRRPGATP
jgi:hypothetical protein